jgi:hypothetical protein
VPTEFAFPKHLQKSTAQRKPPKVRTVGHSQQSAAASVVDDPTSSRIPSSSHESAACSDQASPPDSRSGARSRLLAKTVCLDHSYASDRAPKTIVFSSLINTPKTNVEHSYQLTETPRKLKRRLLESNNSLQRVKKRLKLFQQKSRRLCNKVNSLKQLFDELGKSVYYLNERLTIYKILFHQPR